jgi:signal transduction histidine kinase
MVGGEIRARVADDGQAVLGRPLGVGIRSMHERAAELGGSVVIERRGDRTCVSAVLPVPA